MHNFLILMLTSRGCQLVKNFMSIWGGASLRQNFDIITERAAWELCRAAWNLYTNSAFALGPRKTAGDRSMSPNVDWTLQDTYSKMVVSCNEVYQKLKFSYVCVGVGESERVFRCKYLGLQNLRRRSSARLLNKWLIYKMKLSWRLTLMKESRATSVVRCLNGE